MSVALIGIGIGSYTAGVLSGGKVELLLTLIGGFGMTIFLFLTFIIQPNNAVLFSFFIFFIAMFSGFYMVPLSSYIQLKIEGRKQGQMIAYSNFVTFILLFIASVLFGVISDNLGTNAVFLFLLIIIISMTLILLFFVKDFKNRLQILFSKKQ